MVGFGLLFVKIIQMELLWPFSLVMNGRFVAA